MSETAGRDSCACTNISLMQLFHELKQKFPGVPDHVVSNAIELYCHDKAACETHLHSKAKASLTHAYHASSSAAAKQLSELQLNPPLRCPNQLVVKHKIQGPSSLNSITCKEPQTATLSDTGDSLYQEQLSLHTDANQNIIKGKNEDEIKKDNSTITSPVINIDNCITKPFDSPSDPEVADEGIELETSYNKEQHTENINYKILKSNKIKSNLNEKLERKGKKTIIKEKSIEPEQSCEKPKRPSTLEFVPNPDIAFKPSNKQPESTNITVSPKTTQTHTPKESTQSGYWPEHGSVNFSVNVNCQMDLHGYEPWMQNYDRPITSVNLTVCTPTSNMASPVQQRDDFEGLVTVTVSPSTPRAPHRRAPPPPSAQITQPTSNEPTKSTRPAPEASGPSLIARQKERLGRLAAALADERSRLAQLTRETRILAAPPPSPAITRRLREDVYRLRDQCATLAKRLEMAGNEPETTDFYSNIYTGQRVPSRPTRRAPSPPSAGSWTCHVCTFRNHGLLDKCEECEMPRILIGTSPPTTLDSGFGSFRDRNRRGIGDSDFEHVERQLECDSSCV